MCSVGQCEPLHKSTGRRDVNGEVFVIRFSGVGVHANGETRE
jgi:hypothetical protein